jgi:hypothetical protein
MEKALLQIMLKELKNNERVELSKRDIEGKG